MKTRITVRCIVAWVFLSALAGAQTPGKVEQRPEHHEPLFFLKIAADVASHVHSESLHGYLGFYVSPEHWASGLSDSDTGRFLKLKEAKPDRSAVFFYSEKRDAVVCVFFDGVNPFGVTTVWADASGTIKDTDPAPSYRAITKEMLKSEKEFSFSESDVAADDGQAFPAYSVAIKEKSTSSNRDLPAK